MKMSTGLSWETSVRIYWRQMDKSSFEKDSVSCPSNLTATDGWFGGAISYQRVVRITEICCHENATDSSSPHGSCSWQIKPSFGPAENFKQLGSQFRFAWQLIHGMAWHALQSSNFEDCMHASMKTMTFLADKIEKHFGRTNCRVLNCLRSVVPAVSGRWWWTTQQLHCHVGLGLGLLLPFLASSLYFCEILNSRPISAFSVRIWSCQ